MKQDVTPIGKARLLERLARWAISLPMTAVRYGFQRVPMYRREFMEADTDAPVLRDEDREIPGDSTKLQRSSAGVGPLFHRRYTIFMTDETRKPEELMSHIMENPNRMAPSRMARFETFDGELVRDLEVGDEFVVRMPGPWDGPVRVIDRKPTAFRLATLRGHMEAGEIEFSAGYDDRGFLRFRIESWARSGDRVFLLLYDRFPLGREMQLHMWSQFCHRVAALSGGVRMSNVTSMTERLE